MKKINRKGFTLIELLAIIVILAIIAVITVPIVLGIINDFEYSDEEITLTNEIVAYTDGITDANNNNNEMYGEDRLLNFFNEFKLDKDPIRPLLNDIDDFTKDAEQYDDMTLLYLKIK